MADQKTDPRSQPLTAQDREDVKRMFTNLCEQVFDELDDNERPKDMYRPLEELIISIATKCQKLYRDMSDPSLEDRFAFEACQRVLRRFPWR